MFREGLIAVNYEARAAGVTRHMRASQAKKICPGIRLVHVETIGDGAREEAEEQAEPDQEVLALNKSRSKQKACLERYRQVWRQGTPSTSSPCALARPLVFATTDGVRARPSNLGHHLRLLSPLVAFGRRP